MNNETIITMFKDEKISAKLALELITENIVKSYQEEENRENNDAYND